MARRNAQPGFSMVELMVALAVFSLVLAGVVTGYVSLKQATESSQAQAAADADVQLALKLIQRDLNMAGYGLARATRVASGDGQQTIAEADAGFDRNGDDDLDDDIATDRLFVANGWEILTDVTVNGAEDGDIATAPEDYFSAIANRRENGGFAARLTNDNPAGSQFLGLQVLDDAGVPVSNLNVNFGVECPVGTCARDASEDDDFKSDRAVIVFGQDGSGAAHLEGHRLADAAGGGVTLLGDEALAFDYRAAGSEVVPAIAWYVERKENDAVTWLYRDQDKVLANVVDMQVEYGYDLDNDGLEWFGSVPPPPDLLGNPSPVDGELDTRKRVEALKSVRVVLTVKRGGAGVLGAEAASDFEQLINLRN